LTKLETAVEQVRKAFPKLRPTDVALLASSLVLTGRHALAVYEDEQFKWPEDYPRLTEAIAKQVEMVQSMAEPPKKTTKTGVEEEPVVITVGLVPNYSAGEERLGSRKDLKGLLSEIMGEGVEFMYSATDVGWQWALDRANWSTISGSELTRRVKVKAAFSQGAVGIEMGTATRKRASRAKAQPKVEEPAAATE
jgi:hypothetical protein